jgi:hypothetical protein
MTNGQAQADRSAVVENVECIAVETEHFGEPVNDLGQIIEAIFESIRCIAEAESGKIWRYHVVAIGKRRNEIPVQ